MFKFAVFNRVYFNIWVSCGNDENWEVIFVSFSNFFIHRYIIIVQNDLTLMLLGFRECVFYTYINCFIVLVYFSRTTINFVCDLLATARSMQIPLLQQCSRTFKPAAFISSSDILTWGRVRPQCRSDLLRLNLSNRFRLSKPSGTSGWLPQTAFMHAWQWMCVCVSVSVCGTGD